MCSKRRPRPIVCFPEPRRRRQLRYRRQYLHQRGRYQRAALRQHARSRARYRSGAARRPRLGRSQGIAQRQYGLRSKASLHRRRRHARHHHQGCAQAIPATACTRVTAMAGVDTRATRSSCWRCCAHCGDGVHAFELISRNCLELVLRRIPGTRDPLSDTAINGTCSPNLPKRARRGALRRPSRPGWRGPRKRSGRRRGDRGNAGARQCAVGLRESIPDAAARRTRLSARISRAIAANPEFLHDAGAALKTAFRTSALICFGHLGDGNLHYNALFPDGTASEIAARA